MPKSVQPKAKSALHEIWQAATGEHAEQAFDQFIVTYEARYPQATNCLLKDRQSLMTFYDFPRSALAAPSNHQSDRVDLCHHPSSYDTNKRLYDARQFIAHDVQAWPVR